MNQPIRQAQGEKGFSQIILLGILAVLILAGASGVLVLREKKVSAPEKIVQQEVSSEDVKSPNKPTPSPVKQTPPQAQPMS